MAAGGAVRQPHTGASGEGRVDPVAAAGGVPEVAVRRSDAALPGVDAVGGSGRAAVDGEEDAELAEPGAATEDGGGAEPVGAALALAAPLPLAEPGGGAPAEVHGPSGPAAGQAIEALAGVAPAAPVPTSEAESRHSAAPKQEVPSAAVSAPPPPQQASTAPSAAWLTSLGWPVAGPPEPSPTAAPQPAVRRRWRPAGRVAASRRPLEGGLAGLLARLLARRVVILLPRRRHTGIVVRVRRESVTLAVPGPRLVHIVLASIVAIEER